MYPSPSKQSSQQPVKFAFVTIATCSHDEQPLCRARHTYDILTIVTLQQSILLPSYATPPSLDYPAPSTSRYRWTNGNYYLVSHGIPVESLVGPLFNSTLTQP